MSPPPPPKKKNSVCTGPLAVASSCASYVFPVSRATWWADTRYDFICGKDSLLEPILKGLPRVTWTNLQHKTRDPWVTATCDLDKPTAQNTWSLSDCHVWPGQTYNTKHVILEWLSRVTWTNLQHKIRDPWVTATCDPDKSTIQNSWSLSDCHVWLGKQDTPAAITVYHYSIHSREPTANDLSVTLSPFHHWVAFFSLCCATFSCT